MQSSLRVFLPQPQQPLRSAQTDWDERDVTKQTLNISVSDSVVSDLPREYHGAVAVVAFIAAQTSILHNEIGGCSCELRDAAGPLSGSARCPQRCRCPQTRQSRWAGAGTR